MAKRLEIISYLFKNHTLKQFWGNRTKLEKGTRFLTFKKNHRARQNVTTSFLLLNKNRKVQCKGLGHKVSQRKEFDSCF